MWAFLFYLIHSGNLNKLEESTSSVRSKVLTLYQSVLIEYSFEDL